MGEPMKNMLAGKGSVGYKPFMKTLMIRVMVRGVLSVSRSLMSSSFKCIESEIKPLQDRCGRMCKIILWDCPLLGLGVPGLIRDQLK